MYKDSVYVAQTVCDAKAEVPIETELLIPDYLPQVFKVVKCFVYLVVLQKQMSAARLTIEGYLRLEVFYQTEENETLCQTEQKIPFTKQIDLREGEFSKADAVVTGETEYVNCRAVNQRRIDIRGAYALNVRVRAQKPQEIITALADCGTEQKFTALQTLRAVSMQEKLMTAEESAVFDGEPEMILHTVCIGEVQEVGFIAGKAVCKGVIHATVLYRNAPGHTVLQLEKQLSFNEVIDAEGADESCIGFAHIDPTGCTIAAGEDGAVTLSVSAILQVKVYRTAEVMAVSDVFSSQYTMEIASQEVILETEYDRFARDIEVAVSGAIPDENARIITALATITQPEPQTQDGVVSLRGRVIVHLLCANTLGEIDCYDKATEYTLPSTYKLSPENMSVNVNAVIKSVSARKVGAEMSAAVLISVQGMVTERKNASCLQNAICTQPLEGRHDILRIYYAQAGEEVFDIAKRYAVSPASISAANGLKAEVLDAKAQLLIPLSLS